MTPLPLLLVTALIHARLLRGMDLFPHRTDPGPPRHPPEEVLRTYAENVRNELLSYAMRLKSEPGELSTADQTLLVVADALEQGVEQYPDRHFQIPDELGRSRRILSSWAEAAVWARVAGLPPGELGVLSDELGEFLMIRFPLSLGPRGVGTVHLVADVRWRDGAPSGSEAAAVLPGYPMQRAHPWQRMMAALDLARRGRIGLAFGLLATDMVLLGQQRISDTLHDPGAYSQMIYRINDAITIASRDRFQFMLREHGLLLCSRKSHEVHSRALNATWSMNPYFLVPDFSFFPFTNEPLSPDLMARVRTWSIMTEEGLLLGPFASMQRLWHAYNHNDDAIFDYANVSMDLPWYLLEYLNHQNQGDPDADARECDPYVNSVVSEEGGGLDDPQEDEEDLDGPEDPE